MLIVIIALCLFERTIKVGKIILTIITNDHKQGKNIIEIYSINIFNNQLSNEREYAVECLQVAENIGESQDIFVKPLYAGFKNEFLLQNGCCFYIHELIKTLDDDFTDSHA